MLKPRDLAKVEFKRVWRGYSEKEVDEFVQKVVSEYEALYKKNQELEEEVQALKERVRKYEQTERQFGEALELARQTAEDLKAAAEQKAQAILAEARTQAADVLRRARHEMEAHAARVRELARQEEAFRSRFRELLESYWSLLEDERRESEHLSQAVVALTQAAAALEPPDAVAASAGEAEAGSVVGPEEEDDGGSAEAGSALGEQPQPSSATDAPLDGGRAGSTEWNSPSDDTDLEETRRLPALGSRSRADDPEGDLPRRQRLHREEGA